MSTHGVLDEIQDHPTWRLMDGMWRTFKYAEPLSRHTGAKHWVDDVNNRRHDPIGLEQVWATKWWPNRQFTFLLSVAEVNAVQARAHAKKEISMPTLEFRKQLAMRMMTNKLNNNRLTPASPVRTRARNSSKHVIVKRQKMRDLGTCTRAHSTCETHCTSPIRAPNAAKIHGAIVNVTLGVPFAWLALEFMPVSMVVEITYLLIHSHYFGCF